MGSVWEWRTTKKKGSRERQKLKGSFGFRSVKTKQNKKEKNKNA